MLLTLRYTTLNSLSSLLELISLISLLSRIYQGSSSQINICRCMIILEEPSCLYADLEILKNWKHLDRLRKYPLKGNKERNLCKEWQGFYSIR